MGMVDVSNLVNFYDGRVRIVSPQGHEVARFRPAEYSDYIAEHTEPWSYAKFCYLKPLGWTGFREGEDSAVFSVAPLARLNVSDGFTTPLAQQEYQRFYATLGPRPVHHTLATHWARVIEMLHAGGTPQRTCA